MPPSPLSSATRRAAEPFRSPDRPSSRLWGRLGAYWWLYATFLSTLLPTALHLAVVPFALGPALMAGGLRDWLAGAIEGSARHYPLRLGASLLLAAWMAVSLGAPMVLFVSIGQWIAAEHPVWGLRLLGFFEWFYRLLPGS